MTTTINAATSGGLINSADTSGILQLQTASTAAVTIDASQNVGVGTASPSGKLDVAGDARVSNSTGNKRFYIGQATPSANDGASLEFQNSNSQYNWAIRSNFNVGGAIEFCPSSSAGGVSYTTPSMVINSAGVVSLKGAATNATGVGITFPASQSASSDANTLDDYEEGTWTPVPTFGGNNTGMSYTSSGTYTKIGRVVTVRANFGISANGSSTGVWRLAGLPFTATSSGTNVGILFGDGFTFTAAQIGAAVLGGESTVTLIQETNGAGPSNWNYLFDTNSYAGGDKFFTVTYFTNT